MSPGQLPNLTKVGRKDLGTHHILTLATTVWIASRKVRSRNGGTHDTPTGQKI